MFAEPPPAPPDCWAQGELLTAGRLDGLGAIWFGACLALMSTGADDFHDVVTRVKDLGMLISGAGREKGVLPFQEGFPAEGSVPALAFSSSSPTCSAFPGDTDVLHT